MRKLGIGLIMLVGGVTIGVLPIYFNAHFDAGKFLNIISIIVTVGGFLTAAAGVLYIKFHSPFRRQRI